MSEHLLSNMDAVPLEVIAAEEARIALSPLEKRKDDLVARLANVTISDEEEMKRTVDVIAMARAVREESDRLLEPIGAPYRDSGAAVRNVAMNFTTQLKNREIDAQNAINAFRKRQREAAAAAKNEQLEAEAELRRQANLAPVQAAPVTQADMRLESVRSDYRGQVFDRKVIIVSIVDARALPDTILKSPGVIAALETAVRQMAKLTRDIPGAKIEDDQASNVKVG